MTLRSRIALLSAAAVAIAIVLASIVSYVGTRRELLDEVRALSPETRGRVLNVTSALGVDPAQLLASRDPSPGEARKLTLAWGMARNAWALILDEPTNHLDLPSIERLESALVAFPGAVLLVSHDEQFARACTSTVWNIADGRVRISSAG